MKDIFDSVDMFKNLVTIRGLEHFSSSRSQGNGTIFLASHFGLIECIPFFLKKEGISECLIYSRKANPDFLYALKSCPQIKVIALEDNSISHYELSEKVLKNNGVVVIFADGFYGRKQIELPFLNRKRFFKVGFAKLAYRSNAAVLPIFSMLNKNGKVMINIQEKLTYSIESSYETFRNDLITQYSKILEDAWANTPEHVLYQHKKIFLSF